MQFWDAWIIRRLRRAKSYGDDKRLRSDCVLVKRRHGWPDKRQAIFVVSQKGGRHWLKVKAGGKTWYWGRLVAWAFCNDRRLTWETFHRLDGRRYYWQARHLSLDECDFCVSNLKVGTWRQNRADYRATAQAKHGKVYRG